MARAEATINIEVKGALQGAAEIKALDKAVTGLERRMSRFSSGASTAGTQMTQSMIAATRTRKVFDSMDKGIKMMGMGLSKVLGLAIKGTLIQMALLSAALVGIHGLFVAGKYLHKAYAWGMTAIAGAAASAAVALGTFAAAQRESQAAMYAFKGKGAPAFGAGINQTRAAMRALQRDADLAGLGVEAINKAYAAMSKSMNSAQIAKTSGLMKNLMDFGAAGKDPAQAAEQVGAVIAALNDSKKSMSDVKAAAKELGPEMENALKKAKVTSKKELKSLIMSGELAKLGGVAGQFEAVNLTLIASIKKYFNLLKADFGDFGQEFLGPAKVAIEKIYRIIRRDLLRVSGSLAEFGRGTMMDSLVSGIEKTSNFFVKLIRKWLPETKGFFKDMAGWWDRVTRWFKITKENLRPYIEGAKAIEGMFKGIWEQLKIGIKDTMGQFNEQVILHKDDLRELGESFGGLLNAIMDMSRTFRKAFFDALPFINDLVNGLTGVVKMLNSVFGMFTGMFGGQGGAGLMALAIIFRQMKGHKGGYLGKDNAIAPNTVNITTPVVNIGGRPIPTQPGGGPPQGPRPIGPGPQPPRAIGPGPVYPALGPGPRPMGAIGPGQRIMGAIGPGSTGGRNLPAVQTGPILYTNQGQPLTGGRRWPFDFRNPPANYPNPDAKLVGRGNGYYNKKGKWVNNPGTFRRLIPGSGITGRTGQVFEQVPNTAGVNTPPGASTSTALVATSQPRIVASMSPDKIAKLQYQVSMRPPGDPERAIAERKLLAAGVTPGSGARFSSGAGGPGTGYTAGTAPGGGGSPSGGMGGPGTAPPGAGGSGTTGATSRVNFMTRMWRAQYNPAFGIDGRENDLFRSKTTGRRYAFQEMKTVKDADGNDVKVPTGRILSTKNGQQIGTINEAGQVSTKGFSGKGTGVGSRMNMLSLANRSRRESALGSAILGNEKLGIGGINNSMTAKMGVGMGMSMASQFMPEEMQGAMALGGMVGQFNPLAGLAVGLGGAALKSQSGLAGGLTGAGAGAAIGTMIAPGIGTAVGAALGAITGAVMGFSNGMKVRAKEAKAAMNGFLDNIMMKEFVAAGQRAAAVERRVAAGGDISNMGAAFSGVAGETAAKYEKLQGKLQKGGFKGKYANSTMEQAGNWAKGGAKIGGGAGALVGGAIGTIGGPLGTAIGAGIGAAIGGTIGSLVGGIAGGVKGLFNRGGRKKQLEKDKAVFKDALKDPAFKDLFSEEELKKLDKDEASGFKELQKGLPDRIDAMKTIDEQTTNRMKKLQDASGKSGAELEQLAKSMGVNLYDPMIDFTDLVTKLGLATRKTAEEIKNLNIDSFVQGISAFDEAIKQIVDPQIYDEAGFALASAVESGAGDKAILENLKKFQESSLAVYDSPIQALYGQQQQLGTKDAPGAAFQPGGFMYGIDPNKFFTDRVSGALTEQNKRTEQGFVGTASSDISAQMANMGFIANDKQIGGLISGMSDANRQKFLLDYEGGKINFNNPLANKTDAEKNKMITDAGFKTESEFMQAQASKVFAQYGQTGKISLSEMDEGANLVADKMDTASNTFKTAVDNFSSNISAYFSGTNKPEWMTQKFIDMVAKEADTATPRGSSVGDTTSSRLSQTMARHSAINGQLTGNRTITSSYRTGNLGSINSDHVTGRAIDLVGQNLGQYAVLTRQSGGFAEFHGTSGSRHLHVVPGPGAIGDTMTPAVNSSTPIVVPGSSTSGGNTYTFHINGGTNSPEEIANVVMQKIKRAESIARERS